MPRVSTPRTNVIAELGEQLRFTSKRVLLRHLDRIDELAAQVDADALYPEDFIVFRVTGYRPSLDDPRMIPGAALRGDLSALAERLSESAGLTEEDLKEPVETIASLTERWGVSRRTLERYRRLGLIARRVDLGLGRRALVFARAGVERFELVHADRLEKAGGFTRFDDEELERHWRAAVRYRRRLGWSLNRIAQRLSARTGRSAEGIRRSLLRQDRRRAGSGDAVFPEPGPPTPRDRLIAVRASRRGIEPVLLAKRSGRRKSAAVRALNDGRADLLRALDLPIGPTPDVGLQMPDADPVHTGLFLRGPTELSGLLAEMRQRVAPVSYEERARGIGYRALLRHAGARVAGLPASTVSGAELDAIETALRWASMLKALLVRSQLRLAIDTLEARLGGGLETLQPARALTLAFGAIASVSEAVDRYDPSRGGRLAAPVSIALQRWASHVPDVAAASVPGRATRLAPAGSLVPDWTRSVAPWQSWLEPDARLCAVLDRLEPDARALLTRRFGFDGRPPETLDELARGQGKRAVHLARAERRAIRHALRLARESEIPA
jgi:RNA polymerase primary sigma factor